MKITRGQLNLLYQAAGELPAQCPEHGSDFGRKGYDQAGKPWCDSCVAPWRRQRAMWAAEDVRETDIITSIDDSLDLAHNTGVLVGGEK